MQFEFARIDTFTTRKPTASDMTERRREQCRRNQARYRERRSAYVGHLEKDIARLKNQLPRLERQHETMRSLLPSTSSAWRVAVEYFRLFRNGYKAPVVLQDYGGEESYESNAQLNFLRAAMTPDVTDGSVFGPDAILEQWRCYSLCHGDMQMELESLEKGPQNSIVAAITTSVTITDDMVRYAFPHLTSDAAGRSLASRLLGWRFVMRGTVRFGWDDATGRVESLICQSDLLTPMLKLLGSLNDVAAVFAQAQITLDDNVVALPSYSVVPASSREGGVEHNGRWLP